MEKRKGPPGIISPSPIPCSTLLVLLSQTSIHVPPLARTEFDSPSSLFNRDVIRTRRPDLKAASKNCGRPPNEITFFPGVFIRFLQLLPRMDGRARSRLKWPLLLLPAKRRRSLPHRGQLVNGRRALPCRTRGSSLR